MALPTISTSHGPDDVCIKLHLPGRVTNDLPEIRISRPAGEGRTELLVFNGYDLVADFSIDD